MFERLKDKQAAKQAANNKPKITLYVDIVSPFAYIGFHALETLPIFQQCEITYVPVFLSGIIQITNNKPPLTIKNKGRWINNERLRLARMFDAPISQKAPPGFPVNTLLTQRALTALTLTSPQHLAPAIRALWTALWVQGQPIHEPGALTDVLAGVLPGGTDEARTLVEKAGEQEVKDLLSQRTQGLVDAGSFGLPWFVATNGKGETQGFWGVDHLRVMVDFLGLESSADGPLKSLL